jgi:glutamate racemase
VVITIFRTMKDKNAYLGVFDSGVGGLTVAKAILESLPNESLLYFGDTARLPYGSKSPHTIIRYSRQIVKFLVSQQVKAIVVACNSASSTALETLISEFPELPIVGVIKPGAQAALADDTLGPIGVIGTKATIGSGVYSKAIKALKKDIVIFSQPCPLLVPLIEEKLFDHPATQLLLQEYLEPLLTAKIRKLILGCTHYPLLRNQIQTIVGRDIQVIDSATSTAEAAKHLLTEQNLLNDSKQSSKQRFYLSDLSEPFVDIARTILGDNHISNLQRLDLEET